MRSRFVRIPGLLLVLLLCLQAAMAHGENKALDAELKSYQKLLEKAEKLAKDKSVKEQIKTSRKTIDRTRKSLKTSDLQAWQSEFITIQNTMRSLSTRESADFQAGVRASIQAMTRLLLTAGAYQAVAVQAHDLMTVTFTTPDGRLSVVLPSDAKPGDLISGSIQCEAPADITKLYVLQILDSPGVACGTNQRWRLAPDLKIVSVQLRDDAGSRILSAEVPLKEKLPDPPGAAQPSVPEGMAEVPFPGDIVPDIEITSQFFRLSTISAPGGTIIITGPFDGDFETTRISVNKQALPLVAEAPGKAILRSLPNAAGPTQLAIQEKEIEAYCGFRNLKLVAWPEKNVLQAGESIDIPGRIEGLLGLKTAITVVLISSTPETIQLDDPQIKIAPPEVSAAGIIEFHRKATGLKQAGPFELALSVDPATVDGPCE